MEMTGLELITRSEIYVGDHFGHGNFVWRYEGPDVLERGFIDT